MSWRAARSLDTFLNQLNAACPARARISDGSIGDANHRNRSSDHNPWYGPGIVTARDFTHDPAHGVDINAITDQLVASRDPRIKYIIANRQILDSRSGNNPWRWVRYSGPNPHGKHFHLSVLSYPLCDDTRPWELPLFDGVDAPAVKIPVPVSGLLQLGSSGARVTVLQKTLDAWYPWLNLVVDGFYGPATVRAVKEVQKRSGLSVDGDAGPLTLRVLHLM